MVTVGRAGEKWRGPSARPVIGRRGGAARAGARRLRVPAARAARRPFFSPRNTRHMMTRVPVVDWLGGVAMLVAAVAWGTLLSLLAS